MPWYELARRPPGMRHHDDRNGDGEGDRHDIHQHCHGEEAVDVRNQEIYLDAGWSYPACDPSLAGARRRDRRLDVDELQHRVEGQLARAFPLACDPARQRAPHAPLLGASLRLEGGRDGHPRNQNRDPNLQGAGAGERNGGEGAAPISKAAQFFHPRPVRDLLPYRDFFSPLHFPSGGAAGREAAGREPPSADRPAPGGGWVDRGGGTAPPRRDAARPAPLPTPEDCVASSSDLAEMLGRDQAVAAPSSREVQRGVQQRRLFGAATTPEGRDPFRRPPRQTTLVRDATTGRVEAQAAAPSPGAAGPGGHRKAKTWDDYGGRPVAVGGEGEGGVATREGTPGQTKKKQEKKRKEKKGDRKKKAKGARDPQKRGENDVGAFFAQGEARPDDGGARERRAAAGDAADRADASRRPGAGAKERTRGRALPAPGAGPGLPPGRGHEAAAVDERQPVARAKKKRPRDCALPDLGTEMNVSADADRATATVPAGKVPMTISEQDFAGLEKLGLKNAASCAESLEQFLREVGSQKHVAFSMLFLDPYTGNYTFAAPPDGDDGGGGKGGGGGGRKKQRRTIRRNNKYTQKAACTGFECTTPFLPTTKKYCTPKTQADCNAWNCRCDEQIRAARGSAALLGAMVVFQNSVGNKENTTGGGGEWEAFLLPLGPTEGQEVEYSRMSSWPAFPFHCDASLTDRWKAFEALLLNKGTKLVTYNAVVSLLPYYDHLASDVADQNHRGSLAISRFAGCLTDASLDDQSRRNPPVFSGCLHSIWDLRLVAWMLR